MASSLQHPVQTLLELVVQEPTLRSQDITAVQSSLRKVISPTFEIVFAGAFSAGKSMLINALLERKLLYSAEGHATGTECKVAYAKLDEEHVVLTFLSQAEISEQAGVLAQCLGVSFEGSLESVDAINLLQQQCVDIIQAEGGKDKSERAKQADALRLLLEGYHNNRDRIQPNSNAIYPMEQLNFGTLEEAAGYARRGSNSAVLKRIEYYCHHELLKDGNVLIDTPGIDAPVKRDAELTYNKIKDSNTSAVISVLKAAQEGELSSDETKLLETIRANPGIRDRVFYTFNRIDKTWYDSGLRERLERLLHDQFQDTTRIYKTSGLLGFYGSQIKQTSRVDRFGLDSIFAEQTRGLNGQEESPLFVMEFKNYCGSGKLVGSNFRIDVRSYEQPNENYVRILSECGTPLIEQLIKDSGIEEFRSAIIRYLTEEKRPQLFANLADDLQPHCIALRKIYIESWQHYDSQPRDVDAMKDMELKLLNHDLKQVGDQLRLHIEQELNQVVASNANQVFEEHFLKLQKRMVSRLDELLKAFSVAEVHKQAQASHKRNSVVPLLGILAEAFYYLANGLESVLEEAAQDVIVNFFQYLLEHIRKQDYYRNLYRLLGNDSGLEERLSQLQERVGHAIRNEARIECDRYVREQPGFYAEGNVSIWQLRQTLQQTSKGYDHTSMVEAEPAIRQLLKLDFEQKLQRTIMSTFRNAINQTLNSHLLPTADELASNILQQYDQARAYLAKTLEKEAEEKIKVIQRQQIQVQQNIDIYNQTISAINLCLESIQLDRQKLPEIQQSDLVFPTIKTEIESEESTTVSPNLESVYLAR